MFGKNYAARMINRSAENEADRRRFLRSAGMAGLGVVGASTVGTGIATAAPGRASGVAEQVAADGAALSDASVLNFALNLEYLEAEFYERAVTGRGLPESLTSGTGRKGNVTGGKKVPFQTRRIRQYAEEIAADEKAHVKFLRTALGSAAVAEPQIDLQASFTAAAQAAGVIAKGEQFDAFANEANFLLAAYLFEDVGVTAYKGAAPLVQNKTFLEAAAGILAVEAYHAANVRTAILTYTEDEDSGPLGLGGLLRGILGGGSNGGSNAGLIDAANKISDARDSLDGSSDLDQGVSRGNDIANIVPADQNGVAFSRSAGQVLNVVYLNPKPVNRGGFFPRGVNGDIVSSGGGS